MSHKSDLRNLAKRIFDLSDTVGWTRGLGDEKWPPQLILTHPCECYDWKDSVTWRLSPEVVLVGQRCRVCISRPLDGDSGRHAVFVFINDSQGYPGGKYLAWNTRFFGNGWSYKVISDAHLSQIGRKTLINSAINAIKDKA